jgi:two-component system phosphate regulon sensor histidine kinase PhoR
MQNPLKKIIAVFVLIALVPVAYIVFEFSTLNRHEEIVRSIYQNQLEAILYSVNQYSDDIISSWALRLNNSLAETRTSPNDSATIRKFQAVMGQMSAVQQIYFSDLKGHTVTYRSEGSELPDLQLTLNKLVDENRDKIKRLVTYQRGGFRKMEPLNIFLTETQIPILFILDEGMPYTAGVMVIDLSQFVQHVLGPKMQTIAQDKFIISAFKEKDNMLVYSTGEVSPGTTEQQMSQHTENLVQEGQRKDFWLLPGYYLGISLREATIDDLVRSRVSTSLVVLFLLTVILAFGIFFLYRNIRREIHLSKSKSEFVSNVSHEIRTPLSLISMYAETLEMNRVPEAKKREYYGIIAKETSRLSRIVNRILDFSQIEANKKKYHVEPVKLNAICSEVLESYFFHWKEKGFTCVYVKEDALGTVSGDREAITEAVINLLDNAIKYSGDKRTIYLATGREGVFQFIEVRDEGIGIARRHQQYIFEQFFRAPTGDIHTTKGSGLGLTLVKKTMDAHHGKIKVDSAPGKGSTFRLYFPQNQFTP